MNSVQKPTGFEVLQAVVQETQRRPSSRAGWLQHVPLQAPLVKRFPTRVLYCCNWTRMRLLLYGWRVQLQSSRQVHCRNLHEILLYILLWFKYV